MYVRLLMFRLRVRLTVYQFDLKFTRGNTIASPNKLSHLQRRYAEKYVNERGKEYDLIIQKLKDEVEQYFKERSG